MSKEQNQKFTEITKWVNKFLSRLPTPKWIKTECRGKGSSFIIEFILTDFQIKFLKRGEQFLESEGDFGFDISIRDGNYEISSCRFNDEDDFDEMFKSVMGCEKLPKKIDRELIL